MSPIRDELCRFIRLNYEERMVYSEDALAQLEHFGDDLIPGLIECLTDGHPEVRSLAVTLLAEARPRSNIAVPDLIDRLNDEDWLVQVAAMFHIGRFGPMAAGAIPYVEPWLECPTEYLRVLAAVAILGLDRNRKELLPAIWDGTTSDNSVVRHMAREFFYGVEM